MKVAIVGYGKMGREVEAALLKRGHSVVVRVDASGQAEAESLSEKNRNGAEVAIEFSVAAAVKANAAIYTRLKIPAVVGTTGWDSEKDAVRSMVENASIGYIAGSNFSIGAHLFFALVEKAAALINSVPDYDIFGYEIHHNQKKDSPSGTALTMAEKILSANHNKKRIQTETVHSGIEQDELHIASLRGGSVPGIHTVLLDSPADTIEIRHSARSRGGFALGAVMAAEWVVKRTGFFSVGDFIGDILRQGGKT